jgi:hypothetical protein
MCSLSSSSEESVERSQVADADRHKPALDAPVCSEATDSTARESPSRWSRVGRRCSAFATNLLGTGFVIVLGLAMGRQLLEWWGVRAPVSADVGSGATTGDASANVRSLRPPTIGTLQDLSFDLSTIALRHGSHSGNEVSVLQELRGQCAGAAQSARPADLVGTEADDAERRLLQRLAGQKPVARGERWLLYELARPLPMVVAVSRVASEHEAEGSAESGAETTSSTAAPAAPETVFDGRRVLSWGVALPSVTETNEPRWTWFAWRTGKTNGMSDGGEGAAAAATAVGSAPVTSADWPGLTAARRVMSMRSPDGVALAAYVASDSAASVREWRDEVDQWMSSRGAKAAGDWIRQRDRSQQVFVRPGVGRYLVQLVELPGEQPRAFMTMLPGQSGSGH